MAEISVVIPCYNQAYYLVDALESVCAQSVPPARVMVVDDGSDDPEEVEKVARTPIRLRSIANADEPNPLRNLSRRCHSRHCSSAVPLLSASCDPLFDPGVDRRKDDQRE